MSRQPKFQVIANGDGTYQFRALEPDRAWLRRELYDEVSAVLRTLMKDDIHLSVCRFLRDLPDDVVAAPISARDLRNLYRAWCVRMDLPIASPASFSRSIRAAGAIRKRRAKGYIYSLCRIPADGWDDVDVNSLVAPAARPRKRGAKK